jgi:putative DNA primase/helicase
MSAASASAAKQIWAGGTSAVDPVVDAYLQTRGLTPLDPAPPCLRFAANLQHPDSYYFPAILVQATNPADGKPTGGIQRLFLARGGKDKAQVDRAKQKMSLGPMKGGVARLAEPIDGKPLLIGEGIETVLTGMQATGLPGWSVFGVSGLKRFAPPDTVKHVVLLAENDQANGKALAELVPALTRRGIKVDIARPAAGIKDHNDYINGESGHSVADGLIAIRQAIKRALAGTPDPIPIRSAGPDARAILPPPGEPMKVAQQFVDEKHLHHDGSLTLCYWRDSWWTWKTVNWREVPRRQVLSWLYRFTNDTVYLSDEGELKPWAPNRRKIGDLIEALGAICLFPDEIDQPYWLDGREGGAIVALKNGLLELMESGEKRLLPHSPLFFNQTAVPFPYDPDAPSPQGWLKFLGQLWPSAKAEAANAEVTKAEIQALGEWFGYVISGRLDQQKILLIVGPTRGGKGVIGRILTALIGKDNVAGPTLNSLSGDFGLAPLIGKSLAIISDARFGGRDGSVVVERLLSISGEDTLTVNRKYRDQWTGKLPCRLHIISNELPRLDDASAAVIGRLLLLPLTASWLGREDKALEAKLRPELSGILNWSLAGLQRLAGNGNAFTIVPSAEQAIEQLRDLSSPVAAFVREECVVRRNCEVRADTLYNAYKAWADLNGQPKKSKTLFGRDLAAAFPLVGRAQQRRDEHDPNIRYRVYRGLDLAINHPQSPGSGASDEDDDPFSDESRHEQHSKTECVTSVTADDGAGVLSRSSRVSSPSVVHGEQTPIPTPPDVLVAAARGAGAHLQLSDDGTLFTVEWRAPFDWLINDALRASYDAVLDILNREAESAPKATRTKI